MRTKLVSNQNDSEVHAFKRGSFPALTPHQSELHVKLELKKGRKGIFIHVSEWMWKVLSYAKTSDEMRCTWS
ncbi:unnamed protein product [Sphenostylis stenocarpa]|uniref:Uncharacterized protein n=1 Tax=Sphenostylis stenocarpa TaxID=92480 RepID=A0AA86SAM1_9FABA|nr:unnamed protein product [Sphenostylis stenocarpa]